MLGFFLALTCVMHWLLTFFAHLCRQLMSVGSHINVRGSSEEAVVQRECRVPIASCQCQPTQAKV